MHDFLYIIHNFSFVGLQLFLSVMIICHFMLIDYTLKIYFFCNDNMSLQINRLHVKSYVFITRVRNIYIGKQDLPYMEMVHVFCTKNEKGSYGVPGENQRPAASH